MAINSPVEPPLPSTHAFEQKRLEKNSSRLMATITIAAKFSPRNASWRRYQFGGEDKCVNSFRGSFKRVSRRWAKPSNFHEKFLSEKKLQIILRSSGIPF